MTTGTKSDLEEILKDVLPESSEIAGDVNVPHVADVAISGRSFEDAFDSTSRGKQLTSVEILQQLLLVAQISLSLIQIAKASKSSDEFKKKAEEQRPGSSKGIDLDLWQKLLSKISSLTEKASAWLK